jgi:hypothetical protein
MYVNRDDQCIVSTTTSLSAIDMRTGEVRWSIDHLLNAFIQPLSARTDLPLLVLQHASSRGEWTLLKIEPTSGAIIWQQTLTSQSPRVAFDADLIVVYDETSVQGYDQAGNEMWERRFQDQWLVESVHLHSGVLVGRYAETSVALTYLARETGEVLWEMTDHQYTPGYVLKKDRQLFYTSESTMILMDVPHQQPVWEVAADRGYVMAHTAGEGIVGSQAVIYTTQAALRMEDGGLLFAYPPGSRFGALTQEFLILLHETEQHNEILLVDKSTGVVEQRLGEKPWFAVMYLTENASTIYLAANQKPEAARERITIPSALILIDKQTLAWQVLPIGTNLGTLQVKVFAEDHVVFIPSFQGIGAYAIPQS